jgi:hypothetical protein
MDEQKVTPRLEDLPTAEIPEVLRIASELQARDRAEAERASHRRALLKAAAEAGLPAEYLERAAAELHARRAARLRRRQRWQWAAAAALGLALRVALSPSQTQVAPYPPQSIFRSIPHPPPPVPLTLVPMGHFTPVDLSNQITQSLDAPMLDRPGNDLSDLGAGVVELSGVPFYPSGVVLVGPSRHAGAPLAESDEYMPREVDGIPVGHEAHRLYFLHGTHFSAEAGTRIGAYIVHYLDGTRAEIPIRYGEDVLDWWARPGTDMEPALSRVVWTGRNDAASSFGDGIRLFMKRWENPYPDRAIESLDMVTGDQSPGADAPAPFLVAVTAD